MSELSLKDVRELATLMTSASKPLSEMRAHPTYIQYYEAAKRYCAWFEEAAHDLKVSASVPEPTHEQCTQGAEVPSPFEDYRAFATYYPQMGGYCSTAVVLVSKEPSTYADGEPRHGCFDAYVWHDGQFPFDDDSRPGVPPAHIHHCDAEQFIRFGQFVLKCQGVDAEAG